MSVRLGGGRYGDPAHGRPSPHRVTGAGMSRTGRTPCAVRVHDALTITAPDRGLTGGGTASACADCHGRGASTSRRMVLVGGGNPSIPVTSLTEAVRRGSGGSTAPCALPGMSESCTHHL